MEIKTAFVILHYMTFKDTCECIDSIQKNIDTPDYRIVVVDNASGNGSYEELCRIYDDEHIILLKNEENLGFARGNNTGISYVREHFDPEFIVVLNNDTILTEKEFYKRTKALYEEKGFSVMGPKILTADGRTDSNPVALKLSSVKKLKAKLTLFRIKYLFSLIGLDGFIFGVLLKKYLDKMNSGKSGDENWEDDTHENVKLHGAFLVFSQKFFEVFDGFDPVTFLYSEEEILYTHIVNKGLKSIYTPEIEIYHKEDSATEAAYGRSIKRRRFVYKCSIDSLKKCIAIKEKYACM